VKVQLSRERHSPETRFGLLRWPKWLVSVGDPHNHSKLSQPHTSPQPTLQHVKAAGYVSPWPTTTSTHWTTHTGVRAQQGSVGVWPAQNLAVSVGFRVAFGAETGFGAPLTTHPNSPQPASPRTNLFLSLPTCAGAKPAAAPAKKEEVSMMPPSPCRSVPVPTVAHKTVSSKTAGCQQ
jgi:hypothetical protein